MFLWCPSPFGSILGVTMSIMHACGHSQELWSFVAWQHGRCAQKQRLFVNDDLITKDASNNANIWQLREKVVELEASLADRTQQHG